MTDRTDGGDHDRGEHDGHGHDHGAESDGHGHGHDHGGDRVHDGADFVWREAAVSSVLDLREAFFEDRDVGPVGIDRIAGRTLAEPVVAEADRPAHDHATMDGYAFDATDDYPLELVDADVFPEDDPPAIAAGQAVRIATGAPLPERANAVLKKEEATVEDGRLRGTDLSPGTYVYGRASNVAAGEELFAAGERLSPKDAILLGDLGFESVPVYRWPDVGVLATGTEIHEERQSDLDSPMLANLVRAWGAEATYGGTVPDDYDRVRGRIADLADEYDVVLTTGGTSVGKKDYVIRALADLGTVEFHRVRIRPGKPVAAARLPDHDAVAFAIPGKPLGAHVVTSLVVRPFFTGERGPYPAVEADLARDVGLGPDGFEYVVPVTLDGGRSDGTATGDPPAAMPLGHVDSPLSVYEDTFDPSVLSSSTRATRADGFVITESDLAAGDRVRVHPYPTVER